MAKKAVKTRVLFFLISSRQSSIGYRNCKVIDFPGKYSNSEIEDSLESWANAIIRSSSVDSCSYGYRRLKYRPRSEVLKAYNKVCKTRKSVEIQYQKLVAALNPIKR